MGVSVVITPGAGGKYGSIMTAWSWMCSEIMMVYIPYTSMPRGSIPFAELCLYSCIFVRVDACIEFTRRSVQRCLLEVCLCCP